MEYSQPIRVAIVDDNEMLRNGLSMFLSVYEEFILVGTASDGEEVLRMCEMTQPDVVLMDLVMPGTDGASATRMLKQAYPHIVVIALTSFDDQGLSSEALMSGATSCLLKNVPIDEMADAIRASIAQAPVASS